MNRLVYGVAVLFFGCGKPATVGVGKVMPEIQLTTAPHGHVLTNAAVWSPDDHWIVYDVRSDPAGDKFVGTRIERVNVGTKETRVLYEAGNGAHCGVATVCPKTGRVVFILGPENPTPEWCYSPTHRRGVIVDPARPGVAVNLDARDLMPPFTPGALRGGSHVHTFDGPGEWVAFTYEDHVLAAGKGEPNQRNVGVSVPGRSVVVSKTHPRNHDGSHFSVLATRTVANPKPGSDEISKAYEESWVGTNGYVRSDGTRRKRAIAFQGHVVTPRGETISEVFVVDLAEDVTVPSEDGPLQGTETLKPRPPNGTVQRRLTFTADRKYPGLQGPRHWLRSSPDGGRIAFLMKDDAGVVQLWTVSPNGGPPHQLTDNPNDIASAFTWSPDGNWIAHAMDGSVCVTDTRTGETRRVTVRPAGPPRPEACVFSPDGKRIAFVRTVNGWNQVFVSDIAPERGK